MSKKLLYLFGEPGSGKITVARVLQERLGSCGERSASWRLFWLHDLDSVCAIVGRYPLPRLMDEISLTVLEELMNGGENIIYVRPSRDRQTVEEVLDLAERMNYVGVPIRLTVGRETAVQRVRYRPLSQFRVSSEADLDRYLSGRPATSAELEAPTVATDGLSPSEVADQIQTILFNQEKTYGDRYLVPAGC